MQGHPNTGGSVSEPRDVSAELQRIDERLDRGSDRMRAIEVELALNTVVTSEIRDILQMARAGLRLLSVVGTVLKWVGTVAAAIASMVGAVLSLWVAYQAFRQHGGGVTEALSSALQALKHGSK